MELGEFTRTTLIELMQADAQSEWAHHKEGGGVIMPLSGSDAERWTEKVTFDVAVTVSDRTESGAAAGIRVWGVDLSGKGSKALDNSTVSRITFSAPVIFSGMKIK